MRPHINGLRSGSGSAPPETATNAETRLRAKRLSPDEDEKRAGKTEVENEKRHLLLYIIPISNLNRFYEETRTAHFHRLHGGVNRRIGAGSLAAETGLAESGAQ